MGGTLLRTFKRNEIQALRAVRWFQVTTVNFPRKLSTKWWHRLRDYMIFI